MAARKTTTTTTSSKKKNENKAAKKKFSELAKDAVLEYPAWSKTTAATCEFYETDVGKGLLTEECARRRERRCVTFTLPSSRVILFYERARERDCGFFPEKSTLLK
jgi:hypothetical protein